MNDLIYFDYSDSGKINHVGVVIHVPRKGWRHRFAKGKIKVVEANDLR